MNKEIHFITNEGKTVKNEQENDFDFLSILHIVYKKLEQFIFHTLLANLFKQRCISSVRSYTYLNNKGSIKTFVLCFLKIYVYVNVHNPLNICTCA